MKETIYIVPAVHYDKESKKCLGCFSLNPSVTFQQALRSDKFGTLPFVAHVFHCDFCKNKFILVDNTELPSFKKPVQLNYEMEV